MAFQDRVCVGSVVVVENVYGAGVTALSKSSKARSNSCLPIRAPPGCDRRFSVETNGVVEVLDCQVELALQTANGTAIIVGYRTLQSVG